MSQLNNTEHVFIAGQTGSGKSFLAETYLAGFETPVVKLDTKAESYIRLKKGQPLWRGYPNDQITLVERLDDIPFVETKKFIYVPPFKELNQDYYNEFFKWAYLKQGITVWVDEAMEVCNMFTIPEYYAGILTRGRVRETNVWSCTQRPKGIHPLLISQSTRHFVFNLQLDQDRQKVSDITGCPEFLEKPQKYNFWYFEDGWENPIKARLNP